MVEDGYVGNLFAVVLFVLCSVLVYVVHNIEFLFVLDVAFFIVFFDEIGLVCFFPF